MKSVLFFLMLCLPSFAFAQNALPSECRQLTEHRAAPDVAFKPGEGVGGKSVVPADINASPIGQEDPIVIPLTIDLAQRLNRGGIRGLELETTPGFLEVSKDGRVTYNGRDLTTQVYALCGQNGSGTDGHTTDDPVKYAPSEQKSDF